MGFKPGQWCSRSKHRPICDQTYAPSTHSPVWKYLLRCWMMISFHQSWLSVIICPCQSSVTNLSPKVVWFTILPVGPVRNLICGQFKKIFSRLSIFLFNGEYEFDRSSAFTWWLSCHIQRPSIRWNMNDWIWSDFDDCQCWIVIPPSLRWKISS